MSIVVQISKSSHLKKKKNGPKRSYRALPPAIQINQINKNQKLKYLKKNMKTFSPGN